MESNLSKVDKILRALLGGVILTAGIYFNMWWGLAGGIIFLTSVFEFCPIYFLLGINSHKKEKKLSH